MAPFNPSVVPNSSTSLLAHDPNEDTLPPIPRLRSESDDESEATLPDDWSGSSIDNLLVSSTSTPEGFRTNGSFTDLGEDIRVHIYNLLLPAALYVRFKSRLTRASPLFPAERKLSTFMYESPENEYGYNSDGLKEYIAMMSTERSVYLAMSKIFYSKLNINFNHPITASMVAKILMPATRRLITTLKINFAYGCYTSGGYTEKTEKADLKLLMEAMEGLRELIICTVDGKADAEKKGSRWKPGELRIMKTILDNSILCKVFSLPRHTDRYRRAPVGLRFVDAAAQIRDGVCYLPTTLVLANIT